MGWSSGTELFDKFCEIMFEPKDKDFNTLLKEIIDAFEDMDWDCQQDSAYWDTPAVQKAMKELHPDWFEDEESE